MDKSQLRRLIKIEERIGQIASEDLGLTFNPIEFDIIPPQKMLEIMAYNIPTNISNWKKGRDYERERTIYEHANRGLPYEVVIHSNPARAYLMNNNVFAVQCLVMAHVYGHCFRGDTQIETEKGPVVISQLKPGDKVLTHTGRYMPIVNIGKRRYKEKVIKVSIDGHKDNVYVTPDHEFFAVKSNNCYKSGRENVVCKSTCAYRKNKRCAKPFFIDYNLEWVPISNLNINDFVVYPKSNRTYVINDTIDINIDKILHKQYVKYNKQININNDFSRLIGYLIADGSMTDGGKISISFNIDEIDNAKDAQAIIEKELNLKVYIKEREDNVLEVSCNEICIAKYLKEHIGHLPENKIIPEFIMRASDDIRVNCVKGIFKGDGYIRRMIGRKSGNFEFTTVSEKLAYQIRNILVDVDIVSYIKPRKRPERQKVYEVFIQGQSVHKLSNIFFGKDILEGNRAFSHNSYTDNNFIYRCIKSIEYEDFDDIVYNIEVATDNSYVLSIGAVVHNCAFFTNNKFFKKSRPDIVNLMYEASKRFNRYEKRFGIDEVERTVDAGHALQLHTDPFETNETDKEKKRRIFEEEKRIRFGSKGGNFGDITGKDKDKLEEDLELAYQKLWRDISLKTPVQPTSDILGYVIDNSVVLQEWQQDVLEVLRMEGQYYWPIIKTKFMNEGFAVRTHEKIMNQLFEEGKLTTKEHADFNYANSLVKGNNPFQLNPYSVGSGLWKYIEECWDKGRHGDDWKNCMNAKEKEEWDTGANEGWEKCLDIVEQYTDWFFMYEFLTPDAVRELELYVYKAEETQQTIDYVITKDDAKEIRKKIINAFARSLVPDITIVNGNWKDAGILQLHHNWTGINLDENYAKETMRHIAYLWGRPVILDSKQDEESVSISWRIEPDGFEVNEEKKEDTTNALDYSWSMPICTDPLKITYLYPWF